MSHQFHQQPQQGQMTDQYGQQPTQSMGGQTSGQQPMTGGQMGGQQAMGGGQMSGQQPMGGQQGTQQMGTQGMTGGQQMGGQGMEGRQSFEDHLTNELRIALEDFTELSHIADWCGKVCATEGLSTSAQITHDIAELADLNASLIARDSMFGPEIADAFVHVGNEALRELQQYQQHPHIAETMSAIERTIDSCSTVLGMVGGGQQMGGQQPMTGGQQGTQGMGGQQMGAQGMTGGQQMGSQGMTGQR